MRLNRVRIRLLRSPPQSYRTGASCSRPRVRPGRDWLRRCGGLLRLRFRDRAGLLWSKGRQYVLGVGVLSYRADLFCAGSFSGRAGALFSAADVDAR